MQQVYADAATWLTGRGLGLGFRVQGLGFRVQAGCPVVINLSELGKASDSCKMWAILQNRFPFRCPHPYTVRHHIEKGPNLDNCSDMYADTGQGVVRAHTLRHVRRKPSSKKSPGRCSKASGTWSSQRLAPPPPTPSPPTPPSSP